MAVYKYIADSDKYECVETSERNMDRLDPCIFAKRIGNAWKPIKLTLDSSVGRVGDFPSLIGYAPVLSQRAWECLRNLLEDHVEVLPAIHPRVPHIIVNVLSVVDCLDQEKSKLLRRRTGSISNIYEYCFKPNVALPPIFRILDCDFVFFTDAVREACERNSLRGLVFSPVPMAGDVAGAGATSR